MKRIKTNNKKTKKGVTRCKKHTQTNGDVKKIHTHRKNKDDKLGQVKEKERNGCAVINRDQPDPVVLVADLWSVLVVVLEDKSQNMASVAANL